MEAARMRGAFRRDLTLAPGPGFRLRRRLAARIFSLLLAVAAVGWGALDLLLGYRWVGAGTIALAAAFVVQLLRAELDAWRFDGLSLRTRRMQLPARQIEGVHLAFEKGRARAWVTMRAGEEYALVEGEEHEVRRIADRLAGALQLASMDPPQRTVH